MKASSPRNPSRRKCLPAIYWGIGIVLSSGCTTTPPPETLIGRVYPIERTVAGRSSPWGTLTIRKAHFIDRDLQDGSYRANDLIVSTKDFAALIAQSKIVSTPPQSSTAPGTPYNMSLSFFDQASGDNGMAILSRLMLDTLNFKLETRTTVTLIAERSDGVRKFFRAESSASAKLNANQSRSVLDIFHLSTDDCFKDILSQMEQEAPFFRGE